MNLVFGFSWHLQTRVFGPPADASGSLSSRRAWGIENDRFRQQQKDSEELTRIWVVVKVRVPFWGRYYNTAPII